MGYKTSVSSGKFSDSDRRSFKENVQNVISDVLTAFEFEQDLPTGRYVWCICKNICYSCKQQKFFVQILVLRMCGTICVSSLRTTYS
jgi:hypothetical protein